MYGLVSVFNSDEVAGFCWYFIQNLNLVVFVMSTFPYSFGTRNSYKKKLFYVYYSKIEKNVRL